MPSNGVLRRLTASRRFRSTFYRLPRWRSLRASKLRAAGYLCEGCGKLGQRLEVHHVQPVGDGSSEAELFPGLEGLRALCYQCHRAQHRKPSAVRGRDEWRARLNM